MLNIIPLVLAATSTQAVLPVLMHSPELDVELMPRSPDQISSFYEARGFPPEMITIIKKQCYITVRISNNSNKKIWLDLADWSFTTTDGKPLKREHRDYWKNRWQQMNMPLSKQSTFRWTLLPESLDYLPGEQEGGNILLPFTGSKIKLQASFKTGENKEGSTVTLSTDKLFCAEDK